MAQQGGGPRSSLDGLGTQLGLAVATLASVPPLFPVLGPVFYLALLLYDMGWTEPALLGLCVLELVIGWLVVGFVVRQLPVAAWGVVIAIYYMAAYAVMALMLLTGEGLVAMLRHPELITARILRMNLPQWVAPLVAGVLLGLGYIGYRVGRRMSRWFKRSRLLARILS